MYTITVKIAASGTAYTDPKDPHDSLAGHMWYSLAEDGVSGGSFGFAPKITELDGPGEVKDTDDKFYASTYYTGTIVIDQEQYIFLKDFINENLNKSPYFFDSYYNFAYNSCVDYVWKALNVININPSDFEGQNIPSHNADNVDQALYKYLMGNTTGWDESLPDKGNYDAIYGSKNDDILKADSKTDAIYGGDGKDDIYGGSLAEKLYGGNGNDFIDGGSGNDTIEGGNDNDTLDGGDGTDTLSGGKGDDNLFGDAGDDTLNGGEDNDTLTGGSGSDTLLGETGNDTLIGSGGADTLNGGEGSDTLMGGDDYDTYLAGNGDTISDSDGKGRVNFEGNMLSGGTFNKDTGAYEGDGGSYSLSGGTLTFTNGSGTITINNYSKDADSLGIHLEDDEDDIIPETSAGHNENFSSPLVLDLNGNGTTSTFIEKTQTYFDMNGDGFKERTSWTESTDGLLTLDLNNDGKVTNGSELFGNNTKLTNGTNAKDGFEALSQYDLNKDNVIDAKDSIYAHLKVWMDANSDGISTSDELKTLQELNITSINLNAKETSSSEAYNQISDISTFTQDGQTKTINDVWFYQDKSDTTYDYTKTIKDSVASLPSIEGSGRVKDLRDAMNDDSVLEAKVTNLLTNASSMSFSNFSSAFKDMVARWTGTDNISTSTTRGEQYVQNHNYSNPSSISRKEVYAYARDVAILEAFAGKNFTMEVDGNITSDVIGTEVSVAMNEAYKELQYSQMIDFLSDAMYGESLTKEELITKLQNTLSTTPNDALSTLLLSTMVYRYGLDTLEAFDNTLLSNATFKTALSTNGISYSVNISGEIVGKYGDVVEGSSGNDSISGSGYIYGGEGNDVLYGSSGKDVIDGGKGDDTIYGGLNNDLLRGGAGNDYIVAGAYESDSYYGHDVLDGGIGNDTLVGTGRNSTYVYRYGDGHDMIIDSGSFDSTGDNLRLENILLSDINVRKSGNDVIIEILDVNNASIVNGSITIKNGVGNGAIEKIMLEDGTYNLNGLLNTQIINGQRVYMIEDDFGNFTLSSLNNIRVAFGEGISVDDIIIQASSGSNNLVIALKEEGKSFSELSNKLTLTNWFSDASRIDTFTFNDGTVLSANDMVNLQGTEGADTVHLIDSTIDVTLSLGGGNDVVQTLGGNDTIDGGIGNDTLKGGAGNDYLKGGTGNDALYGEVGNDTLEGGIGNDMLQGGEGNDTYIFAKGNGKDTIIDTNGENTLSFGVGITADDLMFVKSGNDLIVALKDGDKSFEELSDSITLTNWFSQNSSIKDIEFFDGTSYDEEAIFTQLLKGGLAYGTIGNDTITGTDNDDTIYAQSGNDTIIGEKGNDNLQGGAGDDTYVFNRGDGSDTVYDDYRYAPYYWNPNYTLQQNGGNDTLSFGKGISVDDIIVKASANSNDLIVALKEEGKNFDELSDKIVLKDWFNTNNRIENFTFSDGTTLTTNDIVNLQGTEGADTVHLIDSISDVTLSMQDGDDVVQTASGNDTIDGGAGNDTLKGGAGDDTLLGNDGNDTLYGGTGNNTLKGGAGNDTLQGGLGDDTLIGGSGNDLFQGGWGNDTYVFGKGDGEDTIFETEGDDTLSFGEGITVDDLIVKASANNNDLIIALKEEGKSFDELSDKVVLGYWFYASDRIENFTFSDGTVLSANDIAKLQQATSGDDYLHYTEANDIIDGKEGNDTLVGGDGDDVYLFGRGSGVDTIIDIAKDNDSIAFKSGISLDDIEVQVVGTQMIVALKEEGKSFAELSDKLLLESVGNNDYGIEWLSFEDGTKIDPRTLITQYNGTENNDLIDLAYLQNINPDVTADMSVIIDAKEGHDTVILGNGNNTITNAEYITLGNGNNEISLSTNLENIWISAGDGNNQLNVNDLGSSSMMGNTINGSFGDGDNTFLLNSGDGGVRIESGDGDNTFTISRDVDKVSITVGDGNNTIYQDDTVDDDTGYFYGNEPVKVIVGNGDNEIKLSGKAQDHQITVGDGDNVITVAQEAESNNYIRSQYFWSETYINAGDGNNEISILSGDGTEKINVGDGNNTIEFTSDLDNVIMNVGNGNNIITQLQYGDDDADTISPRVSSVMMVQSSSYYYGGDGQNEDSGSSNNSTYINLGNGSNQVTLGDSNDGVYYYGGDMTITGNNTIDVGAGNNSIALYSDSNQTIITGSNTFSEYSGYSNIMLGNGNNSITVQNGQEASLYLGNGNNHVTVTESSLSNAYFNGGNNTIEITNERLEGMTHSLTFNGGENNITVEGMGTFLSINGGLKNTINLTNDNDAMAINSYETNRIDAGAGNDMIASIGGSSDSYIIEKGDGIDRLYDRSGYDSIVFGEGITTTNISVSVLRETVGDTGVENYSNYISSDMLPSSDTELISLVIRYGNNLEDQIILTDWYNTGRVESFSFSDGTVLSAHDIVSLIGSSESELALGTEGTNTLEAHSGDDTVSAREGNDTYVFGTGDGHDTLIETEGFDTISFKDGISKEDLILQSVGNNLVIFLKEDGKTYNELQDSIVISNWFDESGRIERLSFADGSTMELDDIYGAIDASTYVFYGTPEVDMMEGSDASETIMALASDDVVNGNGGNDLLFGQEGNDILNGGEGNDTLYGGTGNDTYVIARNSGNDTIFDSAGTDKLLFADGIRVDDISVYFKGNDLYVEIEGTTLKLQDWYKADNRIESFSFSDGTTLGINDILALMVSTGDDYARTLEEGSALETLEGSDELVGGSGNDTLMGGDGDDYYDVTFKGNDVVLDSSGNDTLYFDASISPTNLKMTWQQGTHDLVLSSDQFPDTSVTLKGWYDEGNRIEAFEFYDGTVWSVADIIDHLGTVNDDVYNGLEGADNIINARGGDDIISTYEGNDTLNGGIGSDALDAGGGDDILNGEEGDDLLLGGAGNDTYLFTGNFGHDVIIDESNDHSDGGSADKIVFGAGIDASNLVFKTYLNDTNLYIGIKEGDTPFEALSNTITLTNWYDAANRIEAISFSDGTEASIQELLTTALANSGEIIKAYEEGGILVGTPQSDYLVGGSGADEIYGREDDDTLLGNAGDDILVGESGNDILNGGLGDDTYAFGYGDGVDVIHDVATESQSSFAFVVGEDGVSRWQAVSTQYSVDAGNDTLYFAEGISASDLVVSNFGKDLIIQLKGTTDQVTLEGFYESNTRIENFAFSDGTILDATSIETLLYTQGSDTVLFEDSLNHIATGLDGDDVITTSSGNDILEGGVGNDTLNGGLGDDVYVFGKGSGKDIINETGGAEWWQTNGGNDQIFLTGGLTQDDIIVRKVGEDIIIGLKVEGKNFDELSDTITIKNGFSEAGSIETITFEDGSSVLVSDVVIINEAPLLADTEVSVGLKDVRESTGSINATDPDGDKLSYSVSTPASHGTLYVNDKGEWVYKANDGYIGVDSAIVKVDDGNGGVVEQTLNFTLEVSAPNIHTTALSLLEDNSYTNTLSVTNPIGGVLTYEVVDATDHGEFTLNSDGSYSYNPSSNYNGVDSVTLKVTNEYGLSTTQTIELNIASVNDIPTFESSEDEAYVLKNTRIVTGALSASDVDGDTLSYTVSTNPTHGTLTLDQTTGEWSYESLFGYIGSDSATISVSDGKGGVITKELTFASKGLVYEGGDLTISAQTIGDTLELGSIGMDALSFTKMGNNLTISVKDQGVITISDYFTQTHQTLTTLSTSWGDINIGKEAIEQASGTWWWPFGNATAENGVDTLLIGTNYSDKLTGGSGNDVLVGSGNSDKLTGNAGNDLLIAGSGNDTLIGSVGSDTLYGDSGSDILDAKDGDDNLLGGSGTDSLYGGKGADNLNGGGGNDYLRGDLGDDTYYFNLGDGKDTITDTTFSFCSWRGSVDGGDDTIHFGEGIDKEDVTFLMQCGNLSIKYGDDESVVIIGQGNDAGAIERFELSDGSFMSSDDVENIIQQMSAYAKDHGMHLSSISSIEKNADLMQIVSSGWHNA